MSRAKLKVGEPNDKFEEEADRVAELTGNDNGSIPPSAAAQSLSPVESLQRLYGNQAVLQMRNDSGGPSQSGMLQRKCACGGAAGVSGECEECSKKKQLGLQAKLQISEARDIYEREADRVADQVMSTSAHSAVTGSSPRIQRLAGQSTGQGEAAPASVDQALASPGRPLEPELRQDMEQRFGYDFSRVRLHSGSVAKQSAQDLNAHAYTVGPDVVFGAGRFAPETHDGRRLIAHELTHVVQQSGARSGPLAIGRLTNQQTTDLVESIYHEARHAEQHHKVAQFLAGQGKSEAEIAREGDVPANIATQARSKPLSKIGPRDETIAIDLLEETAAFFILSKRKQQSGGEEAGTQANSSPR